MNSRLRVSLKPSPSGAQPLPTWTRHLCGCETEKVKDYDELIDQNGNVM